MQKKFSSASALVFLLGFCFFVTSVDIPGQIKTPNVQEHQGGRVFSSNLANKTSGGLIDNLPHAELDKPFSSSDPVTKSLGITKSEECRLREEVVDQILEPITSTWILNDTTIALLHSDLQQLILCTQPFDRVIMRISTPIVLESTMKISHELELIGESNNTDREEQAEASVVSFTCPESGPALVVNTNHFVAESLKFTNCTNSMGKAAVLIRSNSKAIFNKTTFKDNNNRAVYIGKEANGTFMRTRFEGNSVRGNGGAIYVDTNSHMEINNSTVTGNKAIRGNGGAIFVKTNSTLNISGSRLSNNSGTSGGALHIKDLSTVTMTSSVVTNNNASESGGAMNLMLCKALIINSTVSNNTAQRSGGGFYLDEDIVLDMSRTNVSNNLAQNSGGGMYSYNNNTLNFNASFVLNNRAEKSGGGLHLDDNNSLILYGSSVLGNRAKKHGGGIYLDNYNKINLNSSIISNNTSQNSGGGVYSDLENSLFIQDTNISHNHARKSGGGLYLEDQSLLKLNGSTCSNNSADAGSALYVSKSKLDVCDTIYENNSASSSGAIYASSSRLNIRNCTFRMNNASKGRGGAISLSEGGNSNLISINFDMNVAKNGGALYASNAGMLVENCTFSGNNASSGGACVFEDKSSIRLKQVTFKENHAYLESGGAIYITSSSEMYSSDMTIQNNKAKNDSGGVCVSGASFLNATRMRVISNSASNIGGGIGIFGESSFLCYSCLFQKNGADDGAGIYLHSKSKRELAAQLQDCRFVENSANLSGGGLVYEGHHNNGGNCSQEVESCVRIVLLNTSFVNNSAMHLGSAILLTNPQDLVVSCNYSKGKQDVFLDPRNFDSINPRNLCESWKGNHASVFGMDGVLGTFGKNLSFSIKSNDSSRDVYFDEIKIEGIELNNVRSGKRISGIIIEVMDAFGNKPAPTIPHSLSINIISPDGFFQGVLMVETTKGKGIVSNIIGFKPPGKYEIKFTPHPPTISNASMKFHVPECSIGEEPTKNHDQCQECNEFSYNFNVSKPEACTHCPNGATCKGRYIVPEDGYWHKGPCHNETKKCIAEAACKYKTRHVKLANFTANFTDCDMNDTTLEEYNNLQCEKGYNGSLCGSCAKGYGVTGNLECFKCDFVGYSILRLLGIILYLLVGTALAIKGSLPIGSRRLTRQGAMSPLLVDVVALPMRGGTSALANEEVRQENDDAQETTHREPVLQTRGSSQIALDITNRQDNLVETWKILLNFVQVTSTAATMNVKWTKNVLEIFEMLNVLGFAAINSISRPMDCITGINSTAERAIWRYLFRLFMPMTIIAVLSVYWGYHSLKTYRKEKFYFLRRFWLTVITVIYITYFDLTQMAVKAFNCVVVYDNIDPLSRNSTKHWIEDTSIECYRDSHFALIGIAIVVLTMVSTCFPLLCSVALYKNRNVVEQSNSRAHETLGLLCGPFKTKFVYWECITMMKKALLSMIIVFSYSLGNRAQGLLISLVLMFFLTLQTVCLPFKDEFRSLNYCEIVSLLTSCATYTIVQFFNVDTLSEHVRELASTSLIVLNGGFIIFMVFLIARCLIQLAKDILLSRHIEVSDDMGWFSVLKLYFTNRGSNEAAS